MFEILPEILQSISALTFLEIIGLILGVVSSILLIQNRIITWPFGIAFVIVSIIVLWNAALYGDVILNIIFFVLYTYGWYNWIYGRKKKELTLPISYSHKKEFWLCLTVTLVGLYIFAQFLIYFPTLIDGMTPASLPYWDSLTTMLSFTAIFLTAKKRMDSWGYWLAANVLYTGIYFYKELYYYSMLYLIYIGFAIWGYASWRKIMMSQ